MPRISICALTSILILLSTYFLACSTSTHLSKNHKSGVYSVRSGDVIEILFDYYPDFNQIAIVKPEGTIALKELDDVNVAGLTAFEIKKRLTQKYDRIMAAPVCRVKIHEASSLSLYVGGILNKPGVLRFKEDLTISEGILLAGGLKERLESYKIYIFRNHEGSIKMYKFRLDENWRKDKAKRNFKLAPYDVVFVVKPKSGIKKAKKVI